MMRKMMLKANGVFCVEAVTKILLTFLVCAFVTKPASSQVRFFSQQLDNSSGLSNSCINTIYQDSENLLWLGTWDGLNVHDGSSFHVFNYSKGNRANSIGSNVIYSLGEDLHKNIWIATIEGVSRYDKKSGKFSHYFYDNGDRAKVVDKGYLLAIDSKGNVYAAPKASTSLNYYDAVSDKFIKCTVPGLRNSRVSKLIFDESNKLWMLNDEGILSLYHPNKASLVFQRQLSNSKKITDVYAVNHQVFYTTSDKELFHSSDQSYFNKVATLPFAVRAMAYYKDRYILAWSTIGMGELDRNFVKTNTLNKEIPSLDNIRITSLKVSGKMLWVGTDGNGVLKVREKENHFGLVKQLPGGRPINIPVRAFNEVNDHLWIGTKGNGIIQIKNIGTPQASYSIVRSFHSNLDILDNCVYAIEKGKDGYVYVGSDAPGITLYDMKLQRWINWGQISGSKRYVPFKSVHSILYDRDSSVWLGTESYGLIHLKIKTDRSGNPSIAFFRKYSYTGSSKGPGNNVIYTLAENNADQIWVGCRYGGLSLFDKRTRQFKNYKAFSYEGSLSNNDVLSLYRDPMKGLWIGTSYGLNFLSNQELTKPNPKFKKLTVDDGLPNNTIHGITADNGGFLWASTNKGLVKINPLNQKIVRFKEADGLQSNEFSDNAVWKDSNGYLYFGGIYGFNYFLPQSIKVNTYQPNLLLTEIQLAGNPVDATSLKVLSSKGISEIKSYTLDPKDNFFELKVKAIDFSSFEKCQYAYFLEGNDKVWHYQGENNHLSFSNIPPGKYTLKVKWSNGDGIWTNEVAAFKIHIRQYFWLTGPAFLLYFVLITAAAFLFYRYRRNKLAMQHKLAMEHMLREKDEEVHQEQLNFFTNIAHELQTPLTLIMGALERYFVKNKTDLKSGSNYFLSIVNQQAARLNYLVYQLLEFRKAEAGHIKNQYSQLNISNLLANITELFSQLNDTSKFSFSCKIEPDIQLWMDKDKLEKISFNLLSNAFKHTDPGEVIVFSVQRVSETDQLEIVIANSGCKLTETELNSLFNRFFIGSSDHESKISTGIGLAFTRELVTLLKGTIDVSLKDGWISFKVLLPLSYEPAEENKLTETSERLEKPSYLLRTVSIEQEKNSEQVAENNKKAMISSLEDDDKKSILIIEDEPSIRYLLRDILKDTYLVYEAGDGKEALEIIRKVIPNLIVSDIMMPDMTGLEVCNIIKNTPETCHIPFIILSARGTIEQKTEGYEAGADAYIPKPFQSEHLLVRIRKLLEYQQKLHDLFSKEQFSRKLPEAGMKENDKEFLEQTVALIEKHLDDENLDAAFLEDRLGMSKANFYRKLKALSNMTPGELIKSIRLQQAASLLESSEYTVSEIFYQTGFNNQSHFYREFKKRYDCSPVEYRSRHRLPVA
jgi:CheY-like chemotaxis protein/signal transduction histidine kinase/ligand-binding sensor domain-containing protein/AraC-like DNA-binding protein